MKSLQVFAQYFETAARLWYLNEPFGLDFDPGYCLQVLYNFQRDPMLLAVRTCSVALVVDIENMPASRRGSGPFCDYGARICGISSSC